MGPYVHIWPYLHAHMCKGSTSIRARRFPDENGKAERYIQTIDNTTCSMLAGSLLPQSYWRDTTLAAQYLCNRLPTSTLLCHIRIWEGFRIWELGILRESADATAIIVGDFTRKIWDIRLNCLPLNLCIWTSRDT